MSRALVRDELMSLLVPRFASLGFDDADIVWFSDGERKPDETILWARVCLIHDPMSGEAAAIGDRRFSYHAVLTIQVFTPTGDGLLKADECAMDFINSLRGQHTVSGAIIRKVSASEVGKDGPWDQTNIRAEVEYDTVD